MTCLAGTDECQLRTITASQVSSAVLLSAYIGARVYFVAQEHETDIALIQIMLVTLGTLLYVFLSFALVEDQLIRLLRALKPRYAWAEFGYRVFLPIIVALMPLSITTWMPALFDSWATRSGGPGSDFGPVAIYVVGYHLLIYASFLLWDAIVLLGARGSAVQSEIRAVARGFIATDSAGLCILLLFQAVRLWSGFLAALVLMVFILFTGRQISVVAQEMRLVYSGHGGFGRGILR
jgi:hypothetical protein